MELNKTIFAFRKNWGIQMKKGDIEIVRFTQNIMK